MNLLLDTCTFLWILEDNPSLSERARTAFLNSENNVYLSVMSVWEIVLKHKKGKLPLPSVPELLIPEQCTYHSIDVLYLDLESVLNLGKLSDLHTDPFDRMLASQTQVHKLTLVTPDHLITQYNVPVLW